MTYDGLSQRAPRLVRPRPLHGSDLVVKSPTDTIFRAVYEFGWNARDAILDRPQPLCDTCRPPLRLAAPPCCAQLDLVYKFADQTEGDKFSHIFQKSSRLGQAKLKAVHVLNVPAKGVYYRNVSGSETHLGVRV